MTSQKQEIERLLQLMSDQLMSYISEVEPGFQGRWVPATHLKTQLNLKRDSYPVANKIQNRTGWLFAILARMLEEQGKVEFRKEGNRSYYRCLHGGT